MTGIIFLIEQLAVGLYILIGLGMLLTWRRWLRASRDYRSTHFELERDIARYERGNAITTMILLVEFALVVVGVQQVVAPTLRATLDIEQTLELIAEDGSFETPVPERADDTQIDPSGVNLTPDDLNLQVLATPTLTPTPVGTIIPNAPLPAGCDSELATLQVPANGMRVFEPISVVGIATAPDFAFYSFEVRLPNAENFARLEDHTQPVTEMGELGQFVPSFYEPGRWYQFRVSVFDITNTLRASCTVNIEISEPLPTPTPLS